MWVTNLSIRLLRVSDELRDAGAEVGAVFSGKAERYPYTPVTHALLDCALKEGKQMELCDALYKVPTIVDLFQVTTHIISHQQNYNGLLDRCKLGCMHVCQMYIHCVH